MDNATVPTPPEPRPPHIERRGRIVDAVIAWPALASMAVAIVVDPVALIVTGAAVVAQIIRGWTE